MTDDTNNNGNFRLMVGLALLLVGGVLVLDRLDLIDLVDRKSLPALSDLWPVIPIVIGIRAWMNTEGIARWFGILFTVGGLFALIQTVDILATWPLLSGIASVDFSDVLAPENLIPIVFVIGGLFFVLGGRLNGGVSPRAGGRRIGQLTMFGGADIRPNTDDFRGGWLAAIFGGFEADLRKCSSTQPVSQVDVLFMFGGGTIRVPEHWEVEISGLPLFGGFSVENKAPEPGQATHRLQVRCVAIFGGFSVEN